MTQFNRFDVFVEQKIREFAIWIGASAWLGKERDCINIFAARFLLPGIGPKCAIKDYAQIRVEGGVPQPKKLVFGNKRRSVTKDLVIWSGPLDVAWDRNWEACNTPRVIMEWKTKRVKIGKNRFDVKDREWLTEFTLEYPATLGYVVSVDFSESNRLVHAARISEGKFTELSIKS